MTIKYAYGYFELIEYDDTTTNVTNDDLPELISLDDEIYSDYENSYEYTYDYTYTHTYTYTYSYFE
jgi:hypothetical protein